MLNHFESVGPCVEQSSNAGMRSQRGFTRYRFQHLLIADVFLG